MPESRRRILIAAAFVIFASAALALTACGDEHLDELIEGEPAELGEVSYNVLFSRFLNPNDVEDEAYLVGQPPPPADAVYFGVFLEVKNEGDEEAQVSEDIVIRDTRDEEYSPLSSESLYALEIGGELAPGGELPEQDSTAQTGPIEGSLLLFEIPYATLDLRPLHLVIPGEGGPAEIELDL